MPYLCLAHAWYQIIIKPVTILETRILLFYMYWNIS